MQEENKRPGEMIHNLILESRERLSVTGVLDVDSYDEQSVIVLTGQGELTIKGRDLHIGRIDVASGELNLTGEIYEMSYTDGPARKSGLFSRLLR